MNIFNRIVMILIALALAAFGITTFLLLTSIIIPNQPFLRDLLTLYTAWRAIALLRGLSGNSVLAISTVLALIGLVLLVFEVWGPIARLFRPQEPKSYVVRHDANGQVTVGRSMVTDVARHEAEKTPGVMRAESQVTDRSDGLHIMTRIVLAPDADAPSIGQLLQQRIKEAVQTRVGISVAEVRVSAQTAPLGARQPTPRVA